MSPYGLEKLMVDHYARLYHDLYGLETVALRHFNVFGPGQIAGDYSGVISIFCEQALAGDPITVNDDGSQTRDFVFIDDIIQANLQAATTNAVGEAFNIGTGSAVSIQKLSGVIQRRAGTDPEIIRTDSRSGEIDQSVADITKAQDKLGHEPTMPLRDGLAHTLEWYRGRCSN